ncbi:MAG: hypothetical protein KF860_01255 [Cyclobacteriaceae bacterium]|nr:hypothetical protein [Cyclobacteriaceae bacterium]
MRIDLFIIGYPMLLLSVENPIFIPKTLWKSHSFEKNHYINLHEIVPLQSMVFALRIIYNPNSTRTGKVVISK